MTRRFLCSVALAGLAITAFATPVRAVERTYIGGIGEFLDPDKWTPPGEAPGPDDLAIVLGGAVTLDGDATIAGLRFIGGTLDGSGTLTVTGTLDWQAGEMGGSGTTNAAGALALNSAATIGLRDTRTLVIPATATWTGTVDLGNDDGASLVILPGGSFTIATSADFLGGNVVNQGTVTKMPSSGDGIARLTGAVSNTGLVDIRSGTLDVSGGYTQTAGVTRLNGGALQSSTPIAISGGRLEGTGTVTGTVVNSGEIDPGLSPGAIAITGAYQQGAAGRFAVELGGLTPGTQFDQLTVSGAATLGGALAVSLVGGFAPTLGDSFEVMTFASRTGLFASSTGLVTGVGFGFRPIISATSVVLQFAQEVCDDGQDNDGDSDTDCADIKCAGFVPCSFTPTVTETPTPTVTLTRTPTPTVTLTPTSMATTTATVTETATPTATPSESPTPTVTPPQTSCVGDCNVNGAVTIDDLIRAVNIALGTAALDTCRAADRSRNGAVEINELIAAVNNALSGCPAASQP